MDARIFLDLFYFFVSIVSDILIDSKTFIVISLISVKICQLSEMLIVMIGVCARL